MAALWGRLGRVAHDVVLVPNSSLSRIGASAAVSGHNDPRHSVALWTEAQRAGRLGVPTR